MLLTSKIWRKKMKLLANLADRFDVLELKPGDNFGDRGIDAHKEYAYVQISFTPAPKFKFQHPEPTTADISSIDYLPADEGALFEGSAGERILFNTEKFQQMWPSGFLSFVNAVIAVENYLQRIGYEPQLEKNLAELIDRA
jgi:hypothetical protein